MVADRAAPADMVADIPDTQAGARVDRAAPAASGEGVQEPDSGGMIRPVGGYNGYTWAFTCLKRMEFRRCPGQWMQVQQF